MVYSDTATFTFYFEWYGVFSSTNTSQSPHPRRTLMILYLASLLLSDGWPTSLALPDLIHVNVFVSYGDNNSEVDFTSGFCILCTRFTSMTLLPDLGVGYLQFQFHDGQATVEDLIDIGDLTLLYHAPQVGFRFPFLFVIIIHYDTSFSIFSLIL